MRWEACLRRSSASWACRALRWPPRPSLPQRGAGTGIAGFAGIVVIGVDGNPDRRQASPVTAIRGKIPIAQRLGFFAAFARSTSICALESFDAAADEPAFATGIDTLCEIGSRCEVPAALNHHFRMVMTLQAAVAGIETAAAAISCGLIKLRSASTEVRRGNRPPVMQGTGGSETRKRVSEP